MKQILIVILILTVLAVVAACTVQAPAQTGAPDMANPASLNTVWMRKAGWRYGIRLGGAGRLLHFPGWLGVRGMGVFQGRNVSLAAVKAKKADMPNPASKHCVDQGGKVDIRDEAGGQVGYCIFTDGSECEEWAFFKGECAPGGSYQPLDSADCTDLADAVAKTVDVEVATDTAAFDDYVTSKSGSGCEATATGTGADFESFPGVADALKEMLVAKGWAEDIQYAADGPTSTAAGLKQREQALPVTGRVETI